MKILKIPIFKYTRFSKYNNFPNWLKPIWLLDCSKLMYPNGFNQSPAFIPSNPGYDINYYNPLQFNFQMPAISPQQLFAYQQWQTFQAFYRTFANQQPIFVRDSPKLMSPGAYKIGTPSTCIVIDDEPNKIGDQEVTKFQHNIPISKQNFESYYDIPQKREEKLEDGIHQKIEYNFEKSVGDSDSDFEEKQEASDTQSESVQSRSNGSSLDRLSNYPQSNNLKVQLREIVVFIIQNHGQARGFELERERAKYQHDETLCLVFDTLNKKYSSTFKTRAEVVKYITRKAFSTIKNNSKKKVDSSSKESYEILCKRYFQASSQEIQESGVDIEKRERFLQLLFPYQKNSKNKVQDMELISKLMSSKEFYEDYCLYVKNLDSILEADNNRKLPKFINYILSCVKKNQIDQILKYKRVPWLKSWIDNTKSLARELSFGFQWKTHQTPSKQLKLQDGEDKENF